MITKVNESVLNTPKAISMKIDGRIESNTAMSLENLVRIRPTGLESKKTILDLITFYVIVLCMLVEASTIV
jgi:hypothetical protein